MGLPPATVALVITTTEQSFTLSRGVPVGHVLNASDPLPTGFGFSSSVSGTIVRFSLFLVEPSIDRWNFDFGDGTSQIIEGGGYAVELVHSYPNQTATYAVTLSSVNGSPPYILWLPKVVTHDVSITMPARSRGARH
jgi:hypothetical protein